ncbi:MmcQ/YjbR family DNA-binding protein [uncultured Devosia sp.]|uniref:MmcQ/YjbR family DNA-binding protein n=1 Tax=uncultured Devosia sp. TaxID=211434 RepID=UPI0035C95195
MIDRAGFEHFAASLPGVTFVEQWDSFVAKVGGKVFALWNTGGIVFKLAETSFEVLTVLDGVTQAPYFAKRHWVHVAPAALPDDDIQHYLAASHAIVAKSLTKTLQRELGLLDNQ